MAHAIRRYSGQSSAASGLDVLAGIWLLISPFVLHFSSGGGLLTSDVVCGILVIIMALIRFLAPSPATAWASWVNCLLGIWVLISPWVIHTIFASHAARTNNVVTGIVIAILAFWSATASASSDANDAAVRDYRGPTGTAL